jgi:hypothetical protein
MTGLVFAMPPPQMLLVWPAGLIVVFLIVAHFVHATNSKGRVEKNEKDRRAWLGLVAILCGPFVGAFLASLGVALGDVHPADVEYTYVVLTVIGGIAGLVAGLAFAVTYLDSAWSAVGKVAPAKKSDPLHDPSD